jgi:hypothetical protein
MDGKNLSLGIFPAWSMAMKKLKVNKNINKNKKILLLLLQDINIYWLVITPLVMSLFLLSGFLFVGVKIYGVNIPEYYYAIAGAICIVNGSLSGVFQVIRKEGIGPFGNPIYGFCPVISGIALIVICWVSAAILIFYVLF